MMRYVQWPAQGMVTDAGEDVVWSFQVLDPDGEPKNIAGWTFAFYAVDQHDASNTITVTNGSFSITSASTGKVEMTVARATTLSQGGKVFVAELWRTDSNDRLGGGEWAIRRVIRS